MDLNSKAWAILVLLVAAFAGVAQSRRRKGLPIWSLETVAYTLIAAVLTTLLLIGLKLVPWH